MEFTLQEWEWPPYGAQRYSLKPFRSDCLKEHGFASILVCAVLSEDCPGDNESAVFFRPESSASIENSTTAAPNYVVVEADGLSVRLRKFGARPRRTQIEKFFKSEFEPRFDKARYFHFAANGYDFPATESTHSPLLDCFIGQEEASIRVEGINAAPFKRPPNSWEMPSEQLYAWLCAQLANADSELHFAVNWQSQSVEQQFASFLEEVAGMAELHDLMLAIARSEAELTSDMRWYLGNETRAMELYNSTLNRYCFSDLNGRLQQWASILLRQFPLPQQYDDTIPLCLVESYGMAASFLHVTGQDASFHERLETRHFLRAWVRDKATPTEIAKLFTA